jgi:hypothetical protein
MNLTALYIEVQCMVQLGVLFVTFLFVPGRLGDASRAARERSVATGAGATMKAKKA